MVVQVEVKSIFVSMASHLDFVKIKFQLPNFSFYVILMLGMMIAWGVSQS